VFVSLGKVAT